MWKTNNNYINYKQHFNKAYMCCGDSLKLYKVLILISVNVLGFRIRKEENEKWDCERNLKQANIVQISIL